GSLIAKPTQRPLLSAIPSIINMTLISPTSPKSGAAAVSSLPGCSTLPPFLCSNSRISSATLAAFQTPAKAVGPCSLPSNPLHPLPCSLHLYISASFPVVKTILLERFCPPCASSLVDTWKRKRPTKISRASPGRILTMTNDNTQAAAHPAPPCVMVIFGASGDLTKRKLLPALLNLAEEGLLPKDFAIVGLSFDQMTTEALRQKLAKEVRDFALRPVDDHLLQWLVERVYYVQGDFGDPAAYQRLKDQILAAEKTHNTLGNRFHYLAVAPKFFAPIVKQLGQV